MKIEARPSLVVGNKLKKSKSNKGKLINKIFMFNYWHIIAEVGLGF